MRCDLTDEEHDALARLLSDTTNDDRYPLAARIRLLKRILGRIRPERSPASRPPPIRHMQIHRDYSQKAHNSRFSKITAPGPKRVPMGSVSPPLWVQVLQALAVPVIAAVGAWVALQHMYVARAKLQHDLYDRRYAVFEAVRRFLNEAVSQKIVSSETFHPFVLGTADAQFLFDDGLAAYLKEMREHAAMARSIYLTMESIPEGAPQKAAASKAAGERVSWLVNQIDGLTEKFRPFLTLDRRSRSPLHFFLNMRRGLLRLWIVVSVVWVLVIGINGSAQLLEILAMLHLPYRAQ